MYINLPILFRYSFLLSKNMLHESKGSTKKKTPAWVRPERNGVLGLLAERAAASPEVDVVFGGVLRVVVLDHVEIPRAAERALVVIEGDRELDVGEGVGIEDLEPDQALERCVLAEVVSASVVSVQVQRLVVGDEPGGVFDIITVFLELAHEELDVEFGLQQRVELLGVREHCEEIVPAVTLPRGAPRGPVDVVVDGVCGDHLRRAPDHLLTPPDGEGDCGEHGDDDEIVIFQLVLSFVRFRFSLSRKKGTLAHPAPLFEHKKCAKRDLGTRVKERLREVNSVRENGGFVNGK